MNSEAAVARVERALLPAAFDLDLAFDLVIPTRERSETGGIRCLH